MYSEALLKEAHRHSIFNRKELEAGLVCSCFYCLGTFGPDKIVSWVHEGAGTALCPVCGIDSVIGEKSGLPINDPTFLSDMHELWFDRTYVLNESSEAPSILGVREEAQPFKSDVDDDYRRHFTPDQIESIERGLADTCAGRTISNEDMFAEIRAKYGW